MKDRENIDPAYLGTVFDRQVRMDQWDQAKASKQNVLILGVGGLGSGVLLSLLRIGVRKIYIVDYDTVDIHNLNRQLMYGLADVGRSKVQAALENSKFHNIGKTEIIPFEGDALKNWQKVVSYAKDSHVIFNCIDWGDRFDAAVSCLCISLKIPLIMGGTFSTSMSIDYFPPGGQPCYICEQVEGKEINQKILPQLIQGLQDLTFLPKNTNPIGRSSVVVCTMCVQMMMSHYLNFLFLWELPESEAKKDDSAEETEAKRLSSYKASRSIYYHNTFELMKFELEGRPTCECCGSKQVVKQIQQRPTNHAEEPRNEEQAKECSAKESPVKASEEVIATQSKDPVWGQIENASEQQGESESLKHS